MKTGREPNTVADYILSRDPSTVSPQALPGGAASRPCISCGEQLKNRRATRCVSCENKRRARPLAERFWERVSKEDSCWLWLGAINASGYGTIWLKDAKALAHRVAYELEVGPIPPGLQLDHLCRNRSCVNPAHLEPVTHAENRRRGLKGVLMVACKRGHAWVPENTYVAPDGERQCRACRKLRRLAKAAA